MIEVFEGRAARVRFSSYSIRGSYSSTMAASHPVSLRATPKGNADKDSLSFLISRISQQRGSFRDLTEESLEAEIRATEEGQVDLAEENDAEDAQDLKPRPEQLAEAREEMLVQIQWGICLLMSGGARADTVPGNPPGNAPMLHPSRCPKHR